MPYYYKHPEMSESELKKTSLVEVKTNEFSSDKELENTDINLDLGAKFLKEHPEYNDYTAEEEKKIIWKIDWFLVPLLLITNTLAAVDKIIISNAAIYGMKTDCHLYGQRYSWVGSIFYFGYLFAEYPANLLLQRFPVGKTLSIAYIYFSIVLICMAACSSFAGLAVTRFLLGMGEAFISPSSVLLLSQFYKTKEQPFRLTWVFSAFSSLFAGVLCYGIGNAHSAAIANWRIIFLTLGAFSIVFSILLYIILPDNPTNAKFFSEREKFIIIHRTQENKTGTENKVFKKYQMIEALKDWKTWCAALAALSINVANSGLVTFAAQIVSGLGFDRLDTILLGMPTGVIMTFSSLMLSLPLMKVNNMRTLAAAAMCLIPITCCVLMMKLTSQTGLLVSYYFFYFYWGPYPTIVTLPMANASGHTKKVTVNAIIFLSYCIANIIGPQFFISSEASIGYPTGYHAILSFLTATIVLLIVYFFGARFENKKRDEKYGKVVRGSIDVDDHDGLDLTDYEKASTFRYVW